MYRATAVCAVQGSIAAVKPNTDTMLSFWTDRSRSCTFICHNWQF